MSDWTLYSLPLWVLALLILCVLLSAVELGYWFGLRRYRASSGKGDGTGRDVTLGALLALLGLLLGFTYAFALGRHDLRKQSVIEEANAIGTAFLRADLAPEPERTELKTRLLEYAQTRVPPSEGDVGRADLAAYVKRTLAAQAVLWPLTLEVVDSDIPVPIKGLIVSSINSVLDAHTVRLAAVEDHIPSVVMLLLILVAAVSLNVATQNAGRSGYTPRGRSLVFSIVLSALIVIIIDFDLPQRGFIRVNQESLQTLVKDMETALAAR